MTPYLCLRYYCCRLLRLRQPGGAQVTLRPYAIASLIVYTLGVPLVFGIVLYVHRKEIEEDQKLREAGTGDTADTNPQYYIRTRYQELYVLFRPGDVAHRVSRNLIVVPGRVHRRRVCSAWIGLLT